MGAAAEYSISSIAYRTGEHVVRRAIRAADGRAVLLKSLDSELSTPERRARLAHEWEVGRRLSIPDVLRALSFESIAGTPTLVLEDFGGVPLGPRASAPMPLEELLPLAIRVTAAVAALHGQGIVHRDLRPENILVDRRTTEVKLSGLAIATLLPTERAVVLSARRFEGSPRYMSPEQTGWTNRAVDARSDLYALGVTLYELLAGRPPFEASDPVEWAHCHVARRPPKLANTVNVPEVVSDIVDRLLAKTPEERYQSARGLEHDLAECHARATSLGRITPFPLGTHEEPEDFRIPQRLYGRSTAFAALTAAFGRAAERGSRELVLVRGAAGVGKSALVQELRPRVVRAKGSFVSGKCDQVRRDVAHLGIAELFREVVLDMLASTRTPELERERAQSAVGALGKLVVDIVPAFELLVGPQPPPPEVPAAERQHRLHVAFQRLASLFAQRGHPVVLFLEDVQWADPSSLALLSSLMSDPQACCVLAVLSAREEAVPALASSVAQMRAAGVAYTEIELSPLTLDEVASLIADTVRSTPASVSSLARLIHAQTHGNPLFTRELLAALHRDHLLAFDHASASWRWDLDSIRVRGLTDDVLALLTERLRIAPPETRETLQLAASLGNTISVARLAFLQNVSEERVREQLDESVREGLLLAEGDLHRFVHDRVQQAAYALLPEERRAAVHHRIARSLQARLGTEPASDELFEVAQHARLAMSVMTDPDERLAFARIFLAAARAARSSTAFEAARRHAMSGEGMLPPNARQTQRDLAFALRLSLAEAELDLGDLGSAEPLLGALLPSAREIREKAAVRRLLVDLHTRRGESARAIENATECLALFDIAIAAHPTADFVEAAEQRLYQKLEERRLEDLADLAVAHDRDLEAASNVLATILPSAYFTDVRLHRLLAIVLVDLALTHGIVPASAMGFAAFGLELCISSRYAEADRFAALARRLVDRDAFAANRGMVYLLIGASSNAFNHPLRTSLRYFRDSFRAALDVGDVFFGSFASNWLSLCRFWIGDPLEEVEREAQSGVEFLHKASYEPMVPIIASLRNLAHNLGERASAAITLDGPDVLEAEFERHLAPVTLPVVTFGYWLHKLIARYLEGDRPAAVAAVHALQPLFCEMRGQWPMIGAHAFCGLALAATEEAAHRSAIGKHLETLRVAGAHCPENVGCLYALLGAEAARVDGLDAEATGLYEEAIGASRKQGFLQWEAIACELSAKHHLARGRRLAAVGYLQAARDAFARWGARAKVVALEREYAALLPRAPSSEAPFAVATEQLDAVSIVKALQSISSELRLESLVATLLRLVLEQGGADRGVLVLRHEGGLVVGGEASMLSGGPKPSSQPGAPIAPELVPASIIGFVDRVLQPVILGEDGVQYGRFASDPYFSRGAPRSLLCVPLLQRGSLAGVLYLENHALAGAFGPDRLAAVQVLGSQAAISLENALLLRQAEVARERAEKAERRASFLAEASAILGGSLELGETLSRLANLCVGRLADWCVIDLVEGTEIRRIAGAHVVPEKQGQLEELARRYPARLDGQSPASIALRGAQSILYEHIEEQDVRAACRDEGHAALLRALGVDTALAVPMISRGQMLGAITLSSSSTRGRYGREDVALVEELARRAAAAVDHASLFRQAQEAIRLRDVFLAVASHELRTPLTALRLNLQLLTRPAAKGELPSPAQLAQSLQAADKQVERLRALIEQLLDVTRLASGQLMLAREQVNLAELVREVVERANLGEQRSSISLRIDPETASTGSWDRIRLDQVVTSLLENAIKFGEGRPIVIAVGGTTDHARLEVEDHGIGIEPADQGRVFGKFERAVSERNFGGLGLGLFIARQIVEAHGGTIAVHSAPARGSTFVVELPRG